MSSTLRVLALLWRSALDPSGARLWSEEDLATARDMKACGLGEIHVSLPSPDEQVSRFVCSDRGHALWETTIELVQLACSSSDVVLADVHRLIADRLEQ